MTIDNTQRAVLTIGALTQLAFVRRNTSLDDTVGLVSVEFLERLVINGSVSERDEILKIFRETESFDSLLDFGSGGGVMQFDGYCLDWQSAFFNRSSITSNSFGSKS